MYLKDTCYLTIHEEQVCTTSTKHAASCLLICTLDINDGTTMFIFNYKLN